jgi:hypothetical protein
MENWVTRQLTNNDVDEEELHLSANGHLAWTSRDAYGPHAHYYDGDYIRQLTIGTNCSRVCAVFEGGVLYISNNYFDSYGEKLMLYNGTDTVELFQSDIHAGILGASAGGHSIAWIGWQNSMGEPRLYLRKGDELIIRSLGSDYIHSATGPAVWGNRLFWPQSEGMLFFGRYLGSPACVNPPRMDATGDCRVTLDDFVVFASEWLSCGYDNPNACL